MNPLLLVAALAAAAAPAKPGKIEMPGKIEGPKLDLQLPELPKADGLAGAPKTKEPELRQAPGDLRATTAGKPGASDAKVESVTHAREFKPSAQGYRPLGRMDAFTVASLPAHIAPFQSCVRVRSDSGVPVMLRASLKAPGGNEVASSRVEVSFSTGSIVDVVISWDAFEARSAGDYVVAVGLDSGAPASYPLPLKAR